MEIRYILPSEVQEASCIYVKSWKYAYKGLIPQSYLDSISSANWVHNLDKDGKKNLVVIENGAIIGTASFCKSRWSTHEDYGEIVSIYFLPDYIGKGYGKRLLNRVIEELKRLKFKNVLLWVLAGNQPARAFYEKYGFIQTEASQTGIIGGKALEEVMYTYAIN